MAVVGLVAGALSLPALATVSSGQRAIFVPTTPTRILDTRVNLGLSGTFTSGIGRDLQVTGVVPIAPSGTATVVPPGATAVVINLTVVGPTRTGFVSVRPADAAGSPTTSTLNVIAAGQTVANGTSVTLPTGGGDAGKIELWYQGSGGGTTHLLVDVMGYYDDHVHDDRYYTEAQTKKIVFDHQSLAGGINSNGSKLNGGPYTSTRLGTGQYEAIFDTTGLGMTEALMPPNVNASASWLCAAGTTIQSDWFSYGSVGGVLTDFEIFVYTFNAAGAAADCAVHFQVNFPSVSIAIPEPPALDAVAKPGNTKTCKNTESGPVCTTK
jgi:hypothetical protein